MKRFCSSSLCYNNVNTKKEDGTKIEYYSLPKNENLQIQYQKILKTKSMNWKNGQICCEHWSSGNREHLTHYPMLLHHLSILFIKINMFYSI